MRHVATLLLIAGCGFPAREVPGPGPSDAQTLDARSQDMPDAKIGGDAAVCTPGFVDVCGQPEPSMAFDVSAAKPLDTDHDPLCKTVSQGGRNLCLIYATEVTIAATGSLT